MDPVCIDCIHYFVTYDQSAPRGCKAHGFKTNSPPSQVVQQSSGIPCQLFQQKEFAQPDTGQPRGKGLSR